MHSENRKSTSAPIHPEKRDHGGASECGHQLFDWMVLLGAYIHPLKVAIIEAMSWIGEPLSAVALKRIFPDQTLGVVSYHLTSMAERGVFEAVGHRQVRGARDLLLLQRTAVRLSVSPRHPKSLLPAILGGGAGSKAEGRGPELNWAQLGPRLIPIETQIVLNALAQAEALSREDIAESLSVKPTSDTVKGILSDLLNADLVQEVETPRGRCFELVNGRNK